MSESQKPKRRWFQFHLSTLLSFTAIAAALMWANAMPYRNSRGFDAYGFPDTMLYVPTQEAENWLFKDYRLPEKWFPRVNGYPWLAHPDRAWANARFAGVLLVIGIALSELVARSEKLRGRLSRTTTAVLLVSFMVLFWANTKPFQRVREVSPGDSFLWYERGWPYAFESVHEEQANAILIGLNVLVGLTIMIGAASLTEMRLNQNTSISWIEKRCRRPTVVLVFMTALLLIWLNSHEQQFTYDINQSMNNGPFEQIRYSGIAGGWPLQFLFKRVGFGWENSIGGTPFVVDAWAAGILIGSVYCVSELLVRRREARKT